MISSLFTPLSLTLQSLTGPSAHLASTPIAPQWLVFPLAGFSFVVVIWHIASVLRLPMPASRRRIRLANGVVMLALIPLIALAFGILSPADARLFVICWLAVIGLLGVMVLLAMLDSANTARIHLDDRRTLRQETRRLLKLHAHQGDASNDNDASTTPP
jgi:hypothetical protein